MQPNELARSSTLSSGALVLHLDVSILLVIFLLFLFNAPRALLYCANNRSEILQGYFLHSTTRLRASRPPESTPQLTEKEGELPEYFLPTLESDVAPKKPWHVPISLSLRNTAASFTQYRVFDNYAVIQVIFIAGHTAAVLYAASYESNPFSNPKRIGWVIASQIPFVYALATKNNVIGLLVGVGYEKLNYLHRHIGRLITIGANVHAIGYIYKWTLAGNISKKIAQSHIHWGVVALVCIDLLGILSLQRVRTKSYNLFFGTHTVSLVVVLFAMCYHQRVCVPYVIAGSAVYGLDHVIRATKTRFTTAYLQTIPGVGLTRVQIPSLNAGWRPGQHVRLRIFSTAMGLWQMTEVHPFTIASAANTEEGLVLMCKKTGRWTRKLYELAQTPTDVAQCSNPGGRRVKVMVEGPYGGVADITIADCSGAMFVAGGSGVTFVLSTVQELVLAGAKSRIRVIEVVWSVPDPTALEAFVPLFATLVESGLARLRVSVFYTRAGSRPMEGRMLPPSITLAPGRPNIKKSLNELAISIANSDGAHGAFVGVCGPVGLVKDVADTVRTFDAASKRAMGGIQLHEEVFGW